MKNVAHCVNARQTVSLMRFWEVLENEASKGKVVTRKLKPNGKVTTSQIVEWAKRHNYAVGRDIDGALQIIPDAKAHSFAALKMLALPALETLRKAA